MNINQIKTNDKQFETTVIHIRAQHIVTTRINIGDYDNLSSFDWCIVIAHFPQYHTKCDMSLLNDHQWQYIIEHQPQFKHHTMYKLKML